MKTLLLKRVIMGELLLVISTTASSMNIDSYPEQSFQNSNKLLSEVKPLVNNHDSNNNQKGFNQFLGKIKPSIDRLKALYDKASLKEKRQYMPKLLSLCETNYQHYLNDYLAYIYENFILPDAKAVITQHTDKTMDVSYMPYLVWQVLMKNEQFKPTTIAQGKLFICTDINENNINNQYLNFFYCRDNGTVRIVKLSRNHYLKHEREQKDMEDLYSNYLNHIYDKKDSKLILNTLEAGINIFGRKTEFMYTILLYAIENNFIQTSLITPKILQWMIELRSEQGTALFHEILNNSIQEQISTIQEKIQQKDNISKQDNINIKVLSVYKDDIYNIEGYNSKEKNFIIENKNNNTKVLVQIEDNPNDNNLVDLYVSLICVGKCHYPIIDAHGLMQLAKKCGVTPKSIAKELYKYNNSIEDIFNNFFKLGILQSLKPEDYIKPKTVLCISNETLQVLRQNSLIKTLKPTNDAITNANDSITTDLIMAGDNYYQLIFKKAANNNYHVMIKNVDMQEKTILYDKFSDNITNTIQQYITDNMTKICNELISDKTIKVTNDNENTLLQFQSMRDNSNCINLKNVKLNNKQYDNIKVEFNNSYTVLHLPDSLCNDIIAASMNNLLSTSESLNKNGMTFCQEFLKHIGTNDPNNNLTNIAKYLLKHETQLNSFLNYLIEIKGNDVLGFIILSYLIREFSELLKINIQNNVNSEESKLYINTFEKFTKFFNTKRRIKKAKPVEYKHFNDYINILDELYGKENRNNKNNPVYNLYSKIEQIVTQYK